MNKFQKEFRKSREFDKTRVRRRGRRRRWNHFGYSAAFGALISVITLIAISSLKKASQVTQVEALHITSFRVPPYVPITLPLNGQQQQQLQFQQQQQQTSRHPLDLAKPILLDCDYDYKPDEDTRLTVRWFKNKEAEPFYQWLPELNVRHFADWIKPLVNQSFVSDPYDPMKRYRSLLVRRLSMNLTAQYSCLVSSLASQDMRQASLVVYQPPKSFTFEHQIYPLPSLISEASLSSYNSNKNGNNNAATTAAVSSRQTQNFAGTGHFQSPYLQFNNLGQVRKVEAHSRQQSEQQQQQQQQQQEASGWKARPTQFKGYNSNTKAIVRPPNNNSSMLTTIGPPTVLPVSPSNTEQQQGEKIVYTHDGRPVRRKQQSKRQLNLPTDNNWVQSNKRTEPIGFKSTLGIGEGEGVGGGESEFSSSGVVIESTSSSSRINSAMKKRPQQMKYSIQLHHFQCQATQVTPRPVIVLTLKRDTDAIAQYLHESSSVSIRPYQVSQSEYYSEMLAGIKGNSSHVDRLSTHPVSTTASSSSSSKVISSERHHYLSPQKQQELGLEEQLLVTLYDITVTATVALNVSLPSTYSLSSSSSSSWSSSSLLETTASGSATSSSSIDDLLGKEWPPSSNSGADYLQQHGQQMGINTVLSFRHKQRMSFECHLEITGTEFEQRKRINIKEEEVFQFAEREEEKRRIKSSHNQANGLDKSQESSGSSSLGFSSSSAISNLILSSFNQLLKNPSSHLFGLLASLAAVLFVKLR